MASSCFGYLCDEEDHRHEIIKLDSNSREANETQPVTLEELLVDRKLSRRQRFIIATILASSCIQLGQTPWLAQKMEKRSIFFNKGASNVDLEHPYIRHSFASVKRCGKDRENNEIPPFTRFAVRDGLRSLGILLLELCFEQTIESQDFRSDHYVNGNPHDKTDYLTALDWVDRVFEQEPALEPIIKCCVLCPFTEKADWGNTSFVQAVYGNVLGPLEKIIEKEWPTS